MGELELCDVNAKWQLIDASLLTVLWSRTSGITRNISRLDHSELKNATA